MDSRWITLRVTTGDGKVSLDVPSHIIEAIQNLVKAERRIPAIKFFRAHFNLGLKDALQMVDYLTGIKL